MLMINANYDSSLMSKTESDLIALSLSPWETLVSAWVFFIFFFTFFHGEDDERKYKNICVKKKEKIYQEFVI